MSNPPTGEDPNVTTGFWFVFSTVALVLMAVVPSHALTTNVRMEESCTWRHLAQRDAGGLVVGTLLISTYKLPFLELSRSHRSPWQRTWWKPTTTDATLETNKDITQLCLSEIYDETVCCGQSPAFVLPSVKRYFVRKVERRGDTILREKIKGPSALGY